MHLSIPKPLKSNSQRSLRTEESFPLVHLIWCHFWRSIVRFLFWRYPRRGFAPARQLYLGRPGPPHLLSFLPRKFWKHFLLKSPPGMPSPDCLTLKEQEHLIWCSLESGTWSAPPPAPGELESKDTLQRFQEREEFSRRENGIFIQQNEDFESFKNTLLLSSSVCAEGAQEQGAVGTGFEVWLTAD